MIALAITIPSWNQLTSTVVNRTRTIADATCIKGSDAFVFSVTNAILVNVEVTSTSTNSQSVKLVAIAVAVTRRNIRASAVVNLTRTVADAARIQRSDAVVNVVAYSVAIGIR